jgi:hypothetical protein
MTNQSIAGQDLAGRSCPYCRFPLKQGAPVQTCPACHASHHADCWNDNGGCAVLGCAAAPGVSPAAPPPVTAPVPVAAAPVPVAPARGRRPLLVPGLVALVVSLGAALGYVISQQGRDDPSERAATGSVPAQTTPAPTATPDPAAPVEPRDEDRGVIVSLDRLLTLSARGRAMAAADPTGALANRRRVLRGLGRLDPSSPPLRRAVATFERALHASIAANEARASGLDPSLDDQRATTLKRSFCDRINPIAAEYGFGPYRDSEI